MITLDKYSKVIEWSLKKYPNSNIFESLSPNQISSKIWLIDELSKIIEISSIKHKIEIVGSWYGFPLIQYLLENISIEKIECWDIDKEARMIARFYNEIFNVQDIVSVYNKNYWEHQRTASEATILINTSSEHMKESFYQVKGKWNIFYHKNPIVVIQSNNMKYVSDHINCVDTIDQLINIHKINNVLYSGERTIIEWDETSIKPTNYKRFMVIGKL